MTSLRDHLTGHLDATVPPPADLGAVLRLGRRRRRRRTAVLASSTAVAAVTVGGMFVSAAERAEPDLPSFSVSGEVETGEGLRAYASPGNRLHMAGRAFPAAALEYLDTDAVATPSGVVTFDRGLPVLLTPTGETVLLDRGPTDRPEGFHPTAKADAREPLVAYGLIEDGRVTVKVYDLERRTVVAAAELPCDEGCAEAVIDGLDSGTVFVRTPQATMTWDYWTDEWAELSGRATRVADVRNKVVLYDGPAPTSPADGWRYVAGAIDAQLTFDGEHVLYWDSVLEPSRPGGTPIALEKGPKRMGYAFFTLDTDGSVLVAIGRTDAGGDHPVYDCTLPDGACEALEPLAPGAGDPMFIGNDM